MLEYVSLPLLAFVLGEIGGRIRFYLGREELRFAKLKLALLFFVTSFLLPSFALFSFTSGLLAHHFIRKQDVF